MVGNQEEDFDKREVSSLMSRIDLVNPKEDLFDSVAKGLAEEMAKINKKNKPSQIRKFYDELLMWREKAQNEEKFSEILPLIKMMRSKVYYAKGRDLVSDGFVLWFDGCMGKITGGSKEGLKAFANFCYLYEAFLGFYKNVRPKDN